MATLAVKLVVPITKEISGASKTLGLIKTRLWENAQAASTTGSASALLITTNDDQE
jgi:hypothetical protein